MKLHFDSSIAHFYNCRTPITQLQIFFFNFHFSNIHSYDIYVHTEYAYVWVIHTCMYENKCACLCICVIVHNWTFRICHIYTRVFCHMCPSCMCTHMYIRMLWARAGKYYKQMYARSVYTRMRIPCTCTAYARNCVYVNAHARVHSHPNAPLQLPCASRR